MSFSSDKGYIVILKAIGKDSYSLSMAMIPVWIWSPKNAYSPVNILESSTAQT